MSPQRIAGIALLAIGIALLIIGLNASDSLADQVSRIFTGRFTKATTWYIISGVLVGVVGGLLVAFGGERRQGSAG